MELSIIHLYKKQHICSIMYIFYMCARNDIQLDTRIKNLQLLIFNII